MVTKYLTHAMTYVLHRQNLSEMELQQFLFSDRISIIDSKSYVKGHPWMQVGMRIPSICLVHMYIWFLVNKDVGLRFGRLHQFWSDTRSIMMLFFFYSIVYSGADQRKYQNSALLSLCAGIHRWPVSSPHKGQWRAALIFSLICTRINGWMNNGEAGDLRRHRAHYDVVIMLLLICICMLEAISIFHTTVTTWFNPLKVVILSVWIISALVGSCNQNAKYFSQENIINIIVSYNACHTVKTKCPRFRSRYFKMQFSWQKMYEFWLNLHRILFLSV